MARETYGLKQNMQKAYSLYDMMSLITHLTIILHVTRMLYKYTSSMSSKPFLTQMGTIMEHDQKPRKLPKRTDKTFYIRLTLNINALLVGEKIPMF